MLHTLKAILEKKSALKDIGLYLTANIFNKFLPFVILPILTMYLIPDEYGKWSLYLSILSLIAPFAAMGIPMVLGRNYHLASRHDHQVMMFMGMLSVAVICLMIFAVAAVYSLFYSSFLSLPITSILFIPLLCFAQTIQYINKIMLRHEGKAMMFVTLDIANSVIIRVLGLIAVVYISANWAMLLGAQIVTQILFFFVTFYLFYKFKSYVPHVDLKVAKDLLKMGWPIMPHAIGGIIMTLCDRVILERMTSISDVGIYSLGANLGSVVLVFCFAFNNQWGPWMHRQLKNATPDVKIKIVTYSYLYFITTILLTLGIIMGGSFYILYLIDADYHAALAVLPWVAGGTCFYGLSFVLTHYLIVLGKTGALPVITGFCALLNIALTIYLVDLYGFIGAGQATFISYVVFFALTFFFCQKYYPMPWLSFTKRSIS